MMFDEELVMPFRGIQAYSKLGDKAILYNLELRLPFLIYYFPAIQFLGQINGALFCDIGVTWNNEYRKFSNRNSWREKGELFSQETGWAMSYGFGPRFFLLGLPWQIDFTWEYNPHIGTISDRKTFLRVFPDF